MKTRPLPAALAALILTARIFAQAPSPANPAEPGAAGPNPGPAAAGNAAATPADAVEFNRLSLERLQQKNAKEAVEFAEKATRADPTRPEYFSQLGIALSQRMNEVNFMQMAAMSGRLRKAFEKSVALDPNHVPGLIGLARFYTNAPEVAGGSLVRAAEFGARLEQLNPFLGAVELGRISERGEQYDAALGHFAAAAKLQPDNAGLQYACGCQLARLGRKDEARARFEAALKIDPGHARSRQALAELDAPPPAAPAPAATSGPKG